MAYCHIAAFAPERLPIFSPSDLQEAQNGDLVIEEIWHAVKWKTPLSSLQTRPPDLKMEKGVAEVVH